MKIVFDEIANEITPKLKKLFGQSDEIFGICWKKSLYQASVIRERQHGMQKLKSFRDAHSKMIRARNNPLEVHCISKSSMYCSHAHDMLLLEPVRNSNINL